MENTITKTLQVFKNEELNANIRVVEIDGQPWFIAADVCKSLEIKNSRDALTRLDDDEKGVALTDTLGGKQQISIVNEFGLYNLILGSRKSEAKKFQRWVTHEVLPSIRKTGKYENPQFNRKAGCTFRVGNVDGYFAENGKAFFKLENVARALGQVVNMPDRPNSSYIRWDNVKKMLWRLNYIKPGQKLDKETFIPEDIFYSMVDQSRNATAKEFQAVVKAEMPQKVIIDKKYKITLQHLVKDIRCGAEEIEKTFNVSHLTAIDRAIELKEQIASINLDVLRELLPVEDSVELD